MANVGGLAGETQVTEMRWREAMRMAQEHQSVFQEWTQKAECAKKEMEEKQKQYHLAIKLQQQRERQWERAMKTATDDLEALRSEFRDVSQKAERVAKKLEAREECVKRLHECNPKNECEQPMQPAIPPQMSSFGSFC